VVVSHADTENNDEMPDSHPDADRDADEPPPPPADFAEALDRAIGLVDLDELVRLIDGRCTARDWDGLARLRERCETANDAGRQLWPAAAHAEYRLALEAPARHAAAVLTEGAGRFSPGPLPEVVAQHHEWRDLAAHTPPGAPAVLAAHERVVRGEDCTDLEPVGPPVLDLPLVLTSWEPEYALAEYRSHDAAFPSPPHPVLAEVELPAAAGRVGPDDTADALLELVRSWTAGSDGRADVAVVDGHALEAVAALGPRRVRVAPLDGRDALAWMAWAAASGGAHGRRSGAAAGRFGAWWVLGALDDSLDDWPPDPEDLGAALRRTSWLAWEADEPDVGWRLHLAIEDPQRGRAWAIAAVDA
jgi:hypothetical protein